MNYKGHNFFYVPYVFYENGFRFWSMRKGAKSVGLSMKHPG